MCSLNSLNVSLEAVFETRCQLGEGLFVNSEMQSWVDINKNKLFFWSEEGLKIRSLKYKPSVILSGKKDFLTIGCDKGILTFDTCKDEENLILDVSENHNTKDFRSNDGTFFGKNILLSFMHRTDPKKNPGFIYMISENSINLVEEKIYIANSFIKISEDTVLISDSLKQEIWSYCFDSNTRSFNKKLWAKIDNSAAPDGGCIIDDLVFIALWDDASIGIFSLEGELLKKIDVPAKRPTNCKYDPISSKLWVTSAREDLSINQIKTYPSSGNTFIYNLQF